MLPDPWADRILASTTVASLEMAASAAVAERRPIDTFGLLVALIGQDLIGDWDHVQLVTSYIGVGEHVPDPDPSPAGLWRNIPLTSAAHEALSTTARLADSFDFKVIPAGLLALGVLTDPGAGATRALLEQSDTSHAALLEVVQEEVLGTDLEGLEVPAERVAATIATGEAGPDTPPELPPLVWEPRDAPTLGETDEGELEAPETEEPPPQLARWLGVPFDRIEILRRPTARREPWTAASPDRVIKAFDLTGISEARERSLRSQPAIGADLGSDMAIVPILAVRDDDRWLVVELPRRERSLREHLQAAATGAENRWPARYCADEIANVAQALQALHDLGLVHGNVKPENLLVDSDDHLALTDYAAALGGWVRPETSERPLFRRPLSASGTGVKREKYVAPERFLGETGPSVDQYALGVIALEAFSGPGAPPITAPVHEALMRATAAMPEARFSTIAEFGEALKAAVRQEAPRGVAERVMAISPVARAALGPGVIGALTGLGSAIHEAHAVPSAASLQPLTGMLEVVVFAGTAWIPIWVAGALRRGLRGTTTVIRHGGLAALAFLCGVVASVLLRDHPSLQAVVILPLVVVYGLRALLRPPAQDAAAFLIVLGLGWDRIGHRRRLRRGLAGFMLAVVGAAILSPAVVANRWPPPPVSSPIRGFGSLAAVWNFRALAGAGRATEICRTGVALPPGPRRARCVDLVQVVGALERTDPAVRSDDPVYGEDGAFERFRVTSVPTPNGTGMWLLHPPGTSRVAGSIQTERDDHPHVYIMISRDRAVAENVGFRSAWGYDVEVSPGTKTWKVTSVSACTLVGAGGGMQPAKCGLRDTMAPALVQRMLAQIAKAKAAKDG